ncbi:MAG: serine protease [Gammaproteobacteria bacterium]
MSDRFTFDTFEAFQAHSPRRPYGEAASYGIPFPIDDPFGLRRAIVPVFQRNPDGSAVGVGTAFHVDGWGRLLTADHVVDYTREYHRDQIAPDALIEVDLNRSSHAAVLLGYGVVFGTVNIPESCWAPIYQVDAIVSESNADPLAALRGGPRYQIGLDIAGMSAVLQPDAPPFHTVPVNFQASPKVGDMVFAVGYPELGFAALDGDEIARYLREGMFGVYGKVTNLFPNGRDRTRPSPVFEVEADWRPGMSGGPVFNQQGEVIGVVSYSLSPSDDEPGRGYATCLGMIPEASRLTPTLDTGNPGWRLGFGVYRPDAWHLSGVVRSQDDAERLKAQLPPGYLIGWGSHRQGTDDFVLGSAPYPVDISTRHSTFR